MKHLTKRELEVCKYLTQGLDNSEIAARLFNVDVTFLLFAKKNNIIL